MSNAIEMAIYIKGRIHGIRRWQAVPRIGERIWVQKGFNPDLADDGWCNVRMVSWKEGINQIRIECEPIIDGQ